MATENANGFAGLDKQRLVFVQVSKAFEDRVEAFPISCRFTPSAVNDQVVGIEGHVGVEVVLDHPIRGLDQPIFAAKFGARRGLYVSFHNQWV